MRIFDMFCAFLVIEILSIIVYHVDKLRETTTWPQPKNLVLAHFGRMQVKITSLNKSKNSCYIRSLYHFFKSLCGKDIDANRRKRGTLTTKYYRNDRHNCRGGRHDRGYYTLERMPSHDTQIPKQGIKQRRIITVKYKSSIVLSHAIGAKIALWQIVPHTKRKGVKLWQISIISISFTQQIISFLMRFSWRC